MQEWILCPFTNGTNNNPNKNLDWGVQRRILHPFTNGTNVEQDLHV